MTGTATKAINVLLAAWSIAALAAAVSHFLMPAWTAAGTVWPASPGWQREIAYFDVLLAAVFLAVARSKDVQLKRAATLAIVALSIALGAHHLAGWLVEPRPFHIIFTLGNFSAAFWGLGCLLHTRQADRRL